MRNRKPLIVLILERIALKARCECSTQIFAELCDDLLSAEELTDGTIRADAVIRLERMISELNHPSEQIAKTHLEKIRREIVDFS
ncbi:MAG: hypothetical protein ACD_81C00174G0004 [uncultured bacterium]|nr:MAG: hypothetical protein ACD_81C00174G0004 [uncultured bacterium]